MNYEPKPWEFHGDDWTELGVVFGMLIENDDEQTAKNLRERIMALAEKIPQTEGDRIPLPETAQRQIAAVREWAMSIARVSEGRHWEHPLWLGLTQIKDDFSFLRMVAVLLECMWT